MKQPGAAAQAPPLVTSAAPSEPRKGRHRLGAIAPLQGLTFQGRGSELNCSRTLLEIPEISTEIGIDILPGIGGKVIARVL